MIKKITAFLPALLCGVAAWGVQADPTPMRVVNPDGTTVEVRQVGNENFSYFTDLQGRYIYEQDEKGNLRKAVRNGNLLELNEGNLSLLRAEVEKINVMPRLREEALNNRTGQARKIFNHADDGRTTFPTTGETRSLVVLLEYPECSYSVPDPKALFERKCNEPGFSDYGGRGSVRDYFESVSGGLFSPTFDVVGPVVLPQSSKYYTGGYRMMKFYEAVEYAIKSLDDEIDFSQYDKDGDGVIDTVFFYFAGHGQNDTKDTSLIWPHMYDFRFYVPKDAEQLIVDGVEMGPYACSSELKTNIPEGMEQPWLDGIGTHVHEFGHVLGFPDFYDTAAEWISTNSPGKWSVMDNGNYLEFATCPIAYSAYEKYFCRWIDGFEEMTPGEHYSLETISGKNDNIRALSLRVPKENGKDFHDEWFFFETRTKDGWDAGILEEGMLIWHLNYDKTSFEENKVNINRKPRLEVLHPDGYHERYTWPGADGSAWYLCPDVTTTLKPSNSTKGFSVILDDIRYDEDNKSVNFGFNRISERPSSSTRLNRPTVDIENRSFTLSWDPVEGADDYLVTITCYDEDNWFRTVNGYDEKSSNGEAFVVVDNVMEKFMNFEMTAYVRVVEKVPSTMTSNLVKFTPATSAVEEISLNRGPVKVVGNSIEASAGAKVFDMQGRERRASGLERGVYVVVVEGQSYKVAVR